MNKNRIRGLSLCSTGAYLIALGFILLAQPCGPENLNPTVLNCAVPYSLTETTFFLASLGSLLVVTGVWQLGIGRKRIVAEGAWLVIAVGVAVSILGFLSSKNSSPGVSTGSGEIGIILGLAGTALLAGGVIKVRVGQERPSLSVSTSSWWRKLSWSRKEWFAFALLAVVLVAATAISISVYHYSHGSCTTCGCGGLVTPCPGREALNVESYSFNSPTNATLDIRSTGTVSVTMIDYYVKDSTGNMYSSTNWLGPTALPNALVHANIFVDGNAITFQTGNTYTITVITSRNNQFTFTVFDPVPP